MKTKCCSPFVFLLVSATALLGQGTVNFNNSVLSQPPDRAIRNWDGSPLAGSPIADPPSYVAQLYYGADATSLQAVTTAPARFRPPGIALAGTWLGGTRTLTGFSSGMSATLVVRVWDSTGGLTFDQARSRGAFWGVCQPFTYTVPPPGLPPAAFFMEDFRPFVLIPEPAAVSLTLMGATAFLLFARRKQLALRQSSLHCKGENQGPDETIPLHCHPGPERFL